MSEKCEAGCKMFYGGEVVHHKDCVFYPESFTKICDEKIVNATPQELIKNKFVKQLVEDLKKTKGLRQSPGCEQIIRKALKPFDKEGKDV